MCVSSLATQQPRDWAINPLKLRARLKYGKRRRHSSSDFGHGIVLHGFGQGRVFSAKISCNGFFLKVVCVLFCVLLLLSVCSELSTTVFYVLCLAMFSMPSSGFGLRSQRWCSLEKYVAMDFSCTKSSSNVLFYKHSDFWLLYKIQVWAWSLFHKRSMSFL